MVMLAITSWLLGTDLAVYLSPDRRSERPAPMRLIVSLLIFLFVFSISAFFSYTYYYRTVSNLGGKGLTAEEQPGQLADRVAPRLLREVTAAYAGDIRRTDDDPTVKAWSDNIVRLIDAAGGPTGQKIEQKLKELQQRAREASQKLGELQARRDGKKAEIEGYDGTLKANGDKLADLRKQYADADAAFTNAINGNDGSGVRGEGPRARTAKASRDRVQTSIDQVTQASVAIQQSRDKAQRELAAIEEDISKR
jgi:hypothetical protein